VAAWVGGAVVGGLVLIGVLLVLGLRLRRGHAASLPSTRSRA
jgi:hypothetical protein